MACCAPVSSPVVGEPFDGVDLVPGSLRHREQAAVGDAIRAAGAVGRHQDHRARAAFAFGAAFFRAGEAVRAHEIQQRACPWRERPRGRGVRSGGTRCKERRSGVPVEGAGRRSRPCWRSISANGAPPPAVWQHPSGGVAYTGLPQLCRFPGHDPQPCVRRPAARTKMLHKSTPPARQYTVVALVLLRPAQPRPAGRGPQPFASSP